MDANEGVFYTKLPSLVFGFHGCDKKIRDKIINSSSEHLTPSVNKYDWLGTGIYFWFDDPQRGLEWAKQRHKECPSVIGAVIDLGNCLNLADRVCICQLQEAYSGLLKNCKDSGIEIPKNTRKDEGGFPLLRPLDCAVIDYLCSNLTPDLQYDTVMGFFEENEEAYPGAGFKKESHIQICVRNANAIKAYFIPRCK